jgi:ribose transport system ATP-binding protein
VLALDDVDFEVAPGSVHALVGENGAGKSTLMKILSGAVRPDGGTIAIDGQRVDITNARVAQSHGVAIVYQELNLVDDLSVAENVFLGRWPRRLRCVDYPRLFEDTSALFARIGVELPASQPVRSLTVARRQMVEIAKALSLDARLLILDEPSAVLTPHELTALFTLVRELRDRGVSVIYISHRLEEIFEIADTVTVFRDGHHVSTRPIAEVKRFRLIAEMVGRDLNDEFPSQARKIGDDVLQVSDLGVGNRFHDVSFAVRAGEVFALTGLVGSGRTSLGKAIFGALRAESGDVAISRVRGGSRHGPFRHPRDAMKAGIAMLPEDRKSEGLLLQRSLRENITLANQSAVSTFGFFRPRFERDFARRWMEDLRVKAPGAETRAGTLSGGNQQKALLARWMSRPHDVIILDEPTRGVDVGSKYEIYQLINRLADEAVGVVMITSELPEAIGMADRIGVMHEGRLAGVLDNSQRDTDQAAIMDLASGRSDIA